MSSGEILERNLVLSRPIACCLCSDVRCTTTTAWFLQKEFCHSDGENFRHWNTPSMVVFHCDVGDRKTVNVFNDPLPRWKEKYKRFPLVVALALKMLAIPATSPQSERLFSKASQTVTNLQSFLGSDNVELSLFSRTVWPRSRTMMKRPLIGGAGRMEYWVGK